MVQVTDAIAAISRPAAKPAATQRQVLIIGNVGDLGEKVLNRLLSAREYSHVTVAVRAPMRTAHAKLIVHTLDVTHLADATLPQGIDDVVCCISGKANFYKRDDAYLPVTEDMVVPLAEAARRAGVQRFLLVSPMSAWLQMSAVQAAAFGEVELALMQVGLPSTIVLRPSREEEAAATASFAERFAAGWLSVLKGYLVPQSMQHLRGDVIAKAALHFLAVAEPGFKAVSARDIHEWAHPASGPRRGI